MPRLNSLSADRDRIPPGEARFAVKRINAMLRVSPFLIARDGIGKSAFEGNELQPADPEITGHTMRCAMSIVSAPLISIFFGSQPRRAQVPPNGR
jgi:hypothetical protein